MSGVALECGTERRSICSKGNLSVVTFTGDFSSLDWEDDSNDWSLGTDLQSAPACPKGHCPLLIISGCQRLDSS